ncbi:SNF2 family N-terminal domain-containing protein [Phycomyces blakesleeanus]
MQSQHQHQYQHQQPLQSQPKPKPQLQIQAQQLQPQLQLQLQPKKPVERDDDVYIDEDMTNKDVCIGMLRTDIVTSDNISLVKDEQFEPVRMVFQGIKNATNYSIVITSFATGHQFYGWVPFKETNVLGPLIESEHIWCEGIVPRGKVKQSRIPLYIIVYCRPTDVESISVRFEKHGHVLRDPPFFDNKCRYKNPHKHLQESRSSRRNLPAYLMDRNHLNSQTSVEKQARLDIAELLQSIPSDVKLTKKKNQKAAAIHPKTKDDYDNDNNEQEKIDEDDDEDSHVQGLNIVLLPHQVRGVAWMIDREDNERSLGGILADMGLGKTIQTIALIASTMPSCDPHHQNQTQSHSEVFDKDRRVTLIITPLALIQQWATEIRTKTVPGKMKVMVHHGPNRTKDPMEFLKYDVVVTTYQVVASDTPSSEKKGRRKPSTASTSKFSTLRPGCGPLFQIKWHRIVLDEAQQIKNKSTRSATSCSELDAEKRWCLTGTPIQNHVDEIYSLIRFLRIQPLADYQTFKKTISIPILSGQGQIALERLKAVLMAVMLRRTKEVLILHLPLRDKQDIVLSFSPEERGLYELLTAKTRDTVQKIFHSGKGDRNYLNMLCMLLRLRQACDHPQLVLKAIEPDGDDAELETNGIFNAVSNLSSSSQLAFEESEKPGSYCSTCKGQLEQRIRSASNTYLTSTKIEKMIEILQMSRRDHPTEKTIIFSQFTSMLNLMEEPLRQCGFKYCRYDGSMPSQLREKSLEALRTDPECVVMLISLKCGSLGLNLTAANRVILMDIWWNPSVEEQAIDRVHRIGQRLPVHVYRLIIDKTIEQKIMSLQDKKAQMVKGALGDGMIKSTKLTSKEIRSLFDL